MLHKPAPIITAVALATLLLTGCDKKPTEQTVINATTPASTASSVPASVSVVSTNTASVANAASAPVALSPATANTPAIASRTVTTKTTTVTTQAANTQTAPASASAYLKQPPTAEVTPTAAKGTTDNKDNKKVALQADLTQLFKTLNTLDKQTMAKQQELTEKMQKAKTPNDQVVFLKAVVSQFDSQKKTLNSLKFNDPRVAKVRDKMIESIDANRAGTQALIKTPNATPQTHPEIAKQLQQSQQSAIEARNMLMKLTEEAGVKPQPSAGQKK